MSRWRALGAVVLAFTLLAPMAAAPATTLADDLTLDPASADPPVPSIWGRTDSPAARQGQDRSWLWGPVIRAVTREPYQQSPDGAREVLYFDKARLEITNPQADPHSAWYASAGLLVREMITGRIQVGDDRFVQTAPAQTPVTGDVQNNSLSPTYATLAPLASVGSDLDSRRHTAAIGQAVTALLRADGTVVENAVPDSAVRVAGYDDALGHNVPDVFAGWISSQPFAWEYVVGHPLTEPYWVDTLVAGAQRRVLVQAFERRVLTYTPDNPQGWQVEAGNVGLQYRVWRWLEMPDDPQLIPLASGVPLGEVIVGKAVAHGVDPYLFAALAKVASGFDPLAQMSNGGRGLFGVRPELIERAQAAYPLDPVVNADLAASELAMQHQYNSDWRAVLAIYYTGSEHPNWDDSGLNAFVSGVLDTQAEMIASFNLPPATLLTQPEPSLRVVDVGPAAFYSPGYSVEWWHYTLQRHAGWGNAVPGWSLDPNGYYCVHPDFRPGQRLQLTANGVTLWCTIGDSVNAAHVAQWRARWAVELSYNTFIALGLNRNNVVEVRAP